eukprot:jgi/Hompol1/1165/HPOL_002657-RA
MLLLPGRDIEALGRTCHLLFAVANDSMLWRSLCAFHKGIGFRAPDVSWKELYFDKGIDSVCLHLNQLTEDAIDCFSTSLATVLQSHQQQNVPVNCDFADCPKQFPDLWVCMEHNCMHIGCGRTKNKHAQNHFLNYKHCLSLKINTLEMWCYNCQKWLGVFDSHVVEQHKVLAIANQIRFNVGPQHFCSQAMTLRRQYERSLGAWHPYDTIFLIEAGWASRWSKFLLGNGPSPGAINNRSLLLPNGLLNPDLE